MEMFTIAFIVLGAFCAGFVTGLAGFGTGLIALGFWLYVVDPIVAVALVVINSVVAQVQSLYTVRRAFSWSRVWPFLLGGIVGVPLGVSILRSIDPKTLKIYLGLLLIAYTGVALGLRRLPTILWGGKIADTVVGFGGGILGGIAGLSGPLPTIWCGLRGWSADIQRGVYQPFNLAILGIVLVVYATQGILTAQVWELALVSLPASIVGAYIGIRMYGRISDRQFRYLVLWLLLSSGIVLVMSNLL